MTQEEITLSVTDYLKSQGWEMILVDYPQSGGGIHLHPDVETNRDKSKGSIIPDIIAYHDEKKCALIVESDRKIMEKDIKKLKDIHDGKYSKSLRKVFGKKVVRNTLLGLAVYSGSKILEKIQKKGFFLDILFLVEERRDVVSKILRGNNILFTDI